MRRRGMGALSLVISAVIVLALMFVFFKAMPGGGKGGEKLIPGSEQLQRRPGQSIPEAAIDKAKGVQCQNNLRQVRLALQMAAGEEEARPAALFQLSPRYVPAEMLSCPVSGQPYSYDPTPPTGKVWCTAPGHEQY